MKGSKMSLLSDFVSRLPDEHRKTFLGFKEPYDIQLYLDGLRYNATIERDRSPLNVMEDGQCHCLDGGLFATLALWQLGFQPLMLDLVPAPGLDDDHVLALFQIDGLWGAVAKSNFVGLRYREPVHRSFRELVMSYFEYYFNSGRERTLRGYTRPFNLSKYKENTWAWDETATQELYKRFYARKAIQLFDDTVAAQLHLLDERSFAGGTLGTDMDETFPHPA